MRFVCGPRQFTLPDGDAEMRVILYGQVQAERQGSAGEAVAHTILRRRFQCERRAWDLLSISLSVVTGGFRGAAQPKPRWMDSRVRT